MLPRLAVRGMAMNWLQCGASTQLPSKHHSAPNQRAETWLIGQVASSYSYSLLVHEQSLTQKWHAACCGSMAALPFGPIIRKGKPGGSTKIEAIWGASGGRL